MKKRVFSLSKVRVLKKLKRDLDESDPDELQQVASFFYGINVRYDNEKDRFYFSPKNGDIALFNAIRQLLSPPKKSEIKKQNKKQGA
jgi:hypothetical protein